jgi:hypothetical protein
MMNAVVSPIGRTSRRTVLRLGVLGGLGLSLGDWLRLRAQESRQTLAPRTPARARACILVWLAGGPSHIDTLDPKPDASSDVRGEFKPIGTSLPGTYVSELLPNVAQTLEHMCMIRSITTPEADHDGAAHHMMTGYRPSPAMVYPGYGSVYSKIFERDARATLPPYVAVPESPPFASSGYLTPAYDAFSVNADPSSAGFRVRDLTPPDRLTLARLERRRGMVTALDRFARDVPETPLTSARDQFSRRAFELLTSSEAQQAFRLEDESPALRARYGEGVTGQSCLLARRLVERGVGFVTVHDRGGGPLGWDTHAQNFTSLRDRLAPPVDRAIATLVTDLRERGLLESTLVVVMGEFGRTPKINRNAGRDHHGRASSVLLAGGGLGAGRVIGQTDPGGDSPIERPVTPGDLAATVFSALGIDPESTLQTTDSQPVRLVGQGAPVDELFA